MTEDKWAAGRELKTALKHVRFSFASKRRRTLFDCACGKRIVHLMTDERSRRVIEVREREVDGLVSHEELWQAINAAALARQDAKIAIRVQPGVPDRRPESASGWAAAAASTAAGIVAHFAATAAGCVSADGYRAGRLREQEAQADLLRDIFGNPFRPVALDPAWLTSDVLALARGIYDERAFERMPILADALQDAGCDNPDVLTHCRDDKQVHVRGCWVVDLLLGKA